MKLFKKILHIWEPQTWAVVYQRGFSDMSNWRISNIRLTISSASKVRKHHESQTEEVSLKIMFKNVGILWSRLPLLAGWPIISSWSRSQSISSIQNWVNVIKGLGSMPTSESTDRGAKPGWRENSITAPCPPIFRSSMSAPTSYHELLQTSHDVSNVTFHIFARAPKCQNVFASGSAKSPACTLRAPRRPRCIKLRPSGKFKRNTVFNKTQRSQRQPLCFDKKEILCPVSKKTHFHM